MDMMLQSVSNVSNVLASFFVNDTQVPDTSVSRSDTAAAPVLEK